MCRRWSVVVAGVAGSAILVLGAPAGASDYKNFPGSMCLAADGDYQTYMNYLGGRIGNDDTVQRYVVCPIIRDTPSLPWLDLDVQMTATASQATSCTAYCCSTPAADGSTTCDSDTQTVAAGGGTQTMDYPALDDNDYGSCFLRCYIAGGGRMRFYRTEEDITTQPSNDEKRFSGTMCVPENSSQTGLSIVSTTLNSGTSSTRSVMCPIVRDNTSNTTGYGPIRLTGYTPVTDSGGRLECRAYSRDSSGTDLDSAVQAAQDAGNSTLDWASSEVTSSQASWGYYYIYCVLSLVSGVQIDAYSWEEP